MLLQGAVRLTNALRQRGRKKLKLKKAVKKYYQRDIEKKFSNMPDKRGKLRGLNFRLTFSPQRAEAESGKKVRSK